jgi:hypothetical protein
MQSAPATWGNIRLSQLFFFITFSYRPWWSSGRMNAYSCGRPEFKFGGNISFFGCFTIVQIQVKSSLHFEAWKPAFVKKDMEVFMIDLSREMRLPVLKLDFTVLGKNGVPLRILSWVIESPSCEQPELKSQTYNTFFWGGGGWTLIRMTKDEKGLAFFKGLLL